MKFIVSSHITFWWFQKFNRKFVLHRQMKGSGTLTTYLIYFIDLLVTIA